jgi:hypothetical protein
MPLDREDSPAAGGLATQTLGSRYLSWASIPAKSKKKLVHHPEQVHIPRCWRGVHFKTNLKTGVAFTREEEYNGKVLLSRSAMTT